MIINKNDDNLGTIIMMEPLHLLQGFLNLVTKNFCTRGACLGHDKGEEENLDVMFLSCDDDGNFLFNPVRTECVFYWPAS